MILYFSGTGNSLQVAKQLAVKLQDETKSILDVKENDLMQIDRIGFIFPVYNYDVPLFIQEKLAGLNFNPNTRFFVVIAHGGDPGNAIYRVQEILKSKGCVLSYAQEVLLPVNSRVMYGRVTDQIDKRLSEAKKQVHGIADELLADKWIFVSVKKKTILSWVGDLASKKFVTKRITPWVDPIICINCGICSQMCPVGNISEKEGKAFIGNQCVFCMTCIHWCPKVAIHFTGRRIRKDQQYHHPSVQWKDLKR